LITNCCLAQQRPASHHPHPFRAKIGAVRAFGNRAL
jgi:hypothetical protein